MPLLNSVPVSARRSLQYFCSRAGSSYAGLCNGQQYVNICLSLTFSILSSLSASLGFVTIVSDLGFLVIGFLMNFEISYQLFHCALAFFACSWLCSFVCCWRCSFRVRHFIDDLGCCPRTRALSGLRKSLISSSHLFFGLPTAL